MNLGFYNVILSDHLPDGQTYLIGNEILMSKVTYQRSFGWEALADRIGRDFRTADLAIGKAFLP